MSQCPSRPIIQKHQHLREPKLLALAEDAPCMNCGAERKTTVPAHENSLDAGKGMGIKSDDLPALLCDRCHDWYDWRDHTDLDPTGTYNHAKPGETESMWLHAFKKSVKWMLQNRKLKVIA